MDPSGLDKELGSEIDIVIGADKLINHLDLELGMGYFFPGDAFPNADPAQWIRLQIEWNF